MKKKLLMVLWIACLPLGCAAMLWYSWNHCLPDRHTEGFCPEWEAMGMIFPIFVWVWFSTMAGFFYSLKRGEKR